MAIQKPSHNFTKIHLKALQTNTLKILFALSFTVFINTFSSAQDIPPTKEKIKPVVLKDTLTTAIDTLKVTDKAPFEIVQDTTVIDSIQKEKFLKDIVKYTATDYVSVNQRTKKIYLRNNAKIIY